MVDFWRETTRESVRMLAANQEWYRAHYRVTHALATADSFGWDEGALQQLATLKARVDREIRLVRREGAPLPDWPALSPVWDKGKPTAP